MGGTESTEREFPHMVCNVLLELLVAGAYAVHFIITGLNWLPRKYR